MLMGNTNYSNSEFLDVNVEWEEVSMTKAFKSWANNSTHVKCVVDNSHYYYNGWHQEFEIKSKDQITNGKWYTGRNKY